MTGFAACAGISSLNSRQQRDREDRSLPGYPRNSFVPVGGSW
jgi:hypothetical protein